MLPSQVRVQSCVPVPLAFGFVLNQVPESPPGVGFPFSSPSAGLRWPKCGKAPAAAHVCHTNTCGPFFSGIGLPSTRNGHFRKKVWPIGVRVEANPLRPARANSLFGAPFFELFLDRCSAFDFCEVAETAANSSKSGPGPVRPGRRMAGGWSSRLRETHIFKKRPKIGKSAKTGKRPKVLEGIHRSAFWGGRAGRPI